MRRRIRAFAAAAFLLVLEAVAADATMVLRSLSLEETVREAGRVVHARAVEVRAGTDSDGLPATWVTLEVERTLKGPAASRIEIKQFGQSRAAGGGFPLRVPDVPQYTVGEEMVLFLRRESARGFTSPVGFEGGVYRVHSEDGRRVARTRNGEATTALDHLLSEIEKIVATTR